MPSIRRLEKLDQDGGGGGVARSAVEGRGGGDAVSLLHINEPFGHGSRGHLVEAEPRRHAGGSLKFPPNVCVCGGGLMHCFSHYTNH